MAKVVWQKEVLSQLIDEQERRLVAIGLILEGEIKKSMVPGTGAVSITYKGGSMHVHKASAPGEPPAVDTGRLRASISTNWSSSGMQGGKVDGQALPDDGVGLPEGQHRLSSDGLMRDFRVVVGTKVLYAPFLEFGTRRMAARPFMRPALDRLKVRFKDLIGLVRRNE